MLIAAQTKLGKLAPALPCSRKVGQFPMEPFFFWRIQWPFYRILRAFDWWLKGGFHAALQ